MLLLSCFLIGGSAKKISYSLPTPYLGIKLMSVHLSLFERPLFRTLYQLSFCGGFIQVIKLYILFYKIVSAGTNYDCSSTDAVFGCVDSTGTRTCNCNGDLCNKGGGNTLAVDPVVLASLTFAAVAVALKLE